jgi:hypothetical protein
VTKIGDHAPRNLVTIVGLVVLGRHTCGQVADRSDLLEVRCDIEKRLDVKLS